MNRPMQSICRNVLMLSVFCSILETQHPSGLETSGQICLDNLTMLVFFLKRFKKFLSINIFLFLSGLCKLAYCAVGELAGGWYVAVAFWTH